jgi:hypothetical protein
MMWDTRTDAICKSRRETSGEASSTVTSLLDLQSPELWDITFLVFKLPLSVVFCYGSPRTLVHESRLGQRRREERIASLREKRWITSSGMGVDQRSMHFMSMPEESYAIPRKWRGLRSDTLHLFSEEHGWRGTGLPRTVSPPHHYMHTQLYVSHPAILPSTIWPWTRATTDLTAWLATHTHHQLLGIGKLGLVVFILTGKKGDWFQCDRGESAGSNRVPGELLQLNNEPDFQVTHTQAWCPLN